MSLIHRALARNAATSAAGTTSIRALLLAPSASWPGSLKPPSISPPGFFSRAIVPVNLKTRYN